MLLHLRWDSSSWSARGCGGHRCWNLGILASGIWHLVTLPLLSHNNNTMPLRIFTRRHYNQWCATTVYGTVYGYTVRYGNTAYSRVYTVLDRNTVKYGTAYGTVQTLPLPSNLPWCWVVLLLLCLRDLSLLCTSSAGHSAAAVEVGSHKSWCSAGAPSCGPRALTSRWGSACMHT